jgi:hypothetical protein
METEAKSEGTLEVTENMLSHVSVSGSGERHKSAEDSDCVRNIGASVDREVDERADQCLILMIRRQKLPIISRELETDGDRS